MGFKLFLLGKKIKVKPGIYPPKNPFWAQTKQTKKPMPKVLFYLPGGGEGEQGHSGNQKDFPPPGTRRQVAAGAGVKSRGKDSPGKKCSYVWQKGGEPLRILGPLRLYPV